MVSSAFSVDSVADDGYPKKKNKASKLSLLNMPMHSTSKMNGYSAPENSKKRFSDSSKDRGSNPDLYESEYANVEETTSVAKIRKRRKFSSPIPDTVIGKGDEKGLLQKLAHSPLKIPSLPFDVTTVEAAAATAAVAVTVRIAADRGKEKKPRRRNYFFARQ